MDRQRALPPSHLGERLLEALGWGTLSAFMVTGAAAVALAVGTWIYPQRYSQFPEGCFILPLAVVCGFAGAAGFRLIRPRSTPRDMFLAVLSLTLLSAAVVLKLTHDYVRHANVKVDLSPEHVEAMPCSAALCPPATPPSRWTVRGNATLQERADMAARIESIEIVGYEPRVKGGEMIKAASIRYGADEIARTVGSSQLPANGVLSFPLQYDYVTVGGGSRMNVVVYVVTTDAVGTSGTWMGSWNVR